MYFMCNLKELIVRFQDEDTCIKYLVQQRWGGNPVCPYCGATKYYNIENGKRFKCGNKECYKKYSVTVGTVMQATNIPLSTWLPAMYLIASHKKGISSCQLARDLGVTQKTAWFMLHRIRESLKEKGSALLTNTVEVDEVYIGGKMKFKSKSIRKKAHEDNISHTANKTGVMGMLERDNEMRLTVMPENKPLKQIVQENVSYKATIITDGLNAYTGLNKHYKAHEVVNHMADEYVRGTFHTNSIEGAFGLFKRMVIGIYHQISKEHLQRYCDEFTYRYNSRKISDGVRFDLTCARIEGKLTYKQLIENGTNKKRQEAKQA